MNGFNILLKVFMIVLVSVGIVVGVIGAVIANQALIVAGAVLMCIPLVIKFINDLIIQELITATIAGLGIAAITFLYIWSSRLGISADANALDRPVLGVVVGVGIIQLLWIFLVLREV